MKEKIRFDELLKKVKKLKEKGEVDLSLEEDLSIAIMNLVSLEEHFFFTGEKTGKSEYFGFLNEIREIRKTLLGRLVDKHEGETWCIMKHLLAATMRIMEVGTKLLGEGKNEEAQKFFALAYRVYALFWAIRLKLLDLSGVKKIPDQQLNVLDQGKGEKPWDLQDIINKLIDCCDEGKIKE